MQIWYHSYFFTFDQIRLAKGTPISFFIMTLTDILQHRDRISGILQLNNLFTEAALHLMVT